MDMSGKWLATLATIIGMFVGSAGMWFTLKDRIEKQVEDRVTKELTTQTKLARLEERIKGLETDNANTTKRLDDLLQKPTQSSK